MNVIIVAKPLSTPKVLRFTGWRSYAGLLGIAGSVLGVAVALGVLVGARWLGPSGVREELAAARAELETQTAEVERLNQSVARDMNALALRIGRLQAEAARLNALGERLAKIGKLDDGEFDFRTEPALGGPESLGPSMPLSAGDISESVERLQGQLGRQGRQLDMLEALLMDRELDQSLLPAGIPVRQGFASSGYGYRADPFTGKSDFHPGVDFNGPRGSDILAVAGGVVAFSGRKPGYGNTIEIDHGNGFMTRYAHNDRNLAQVGDPVKSGDVIAKMGATGRATGVHVHFEVWKEGRLVNPSEYIRAIR